MWLLIVVFRRTQVWLHQHIFKVGWLLSGELQVTTVVYYIVFLPGIILHELTLWLAAGVLNVSAEWAIRLPEEQSSGGLRLNFIKLSPRAGQRKYSLIASAPVVAGTLALWSIAAQIFDWRAIADYVSAGTWAGLIRALDSLTGTADAWLWFYLAFVIANTTFSSLPARLHKRRRLILLSLSPLFLLTAWGLADELNPAIARNMESFLASLAILALQVSVLNCAAIVALGLVEAGIERLTGKSATYRDGIMLTMTRAEAQALKRKERAARGSAKPAQTSGVESRALKSIYDLKLPIPGPPGREPISRHAVAMVDSPKTKPALATPSPKHGRRLTANPQQPAATRDRAAAKQQSPLPVTKPDHLPDTSGAAPFSRPFVQDGGGNDSERGWEEESIDSDAPFSRPFAAPTRSSQEDDGADGDSYSDDDETAEGDL